MKKASRSKKATPLLQKIWNAYTLERQAIGKEVDKNNKTYYKHFVEYIKGQHLDKEETLSTIGIENYKQYLLKKGTSPITTNKKCKGLALLFNNHMMGTLPKVDYRPVPEPLKSIDDNIHQALTSNEIEALKRAEGLTATEEECRDIFVTQCECGTRFEDLHFVFDLEPKIENGYIVCLTDKRKIYAHIKITPLIEKTRQVYAQKGFKFFSFDFATESRKQTNLKRVNETLKSVAKKAKLDRNITYTDAHGGQITQPLHKIISTHFARHTFITNKINEGLSAEDVKYMVGHRDTQMIERIYGHITSTTITKRLQKAESEIQSTPTTTTQATTKPTEKQLQTMIAIAEKELINSTGEIDAKTLISDIAKGFEQMRDLDFVEAAPLHYAIQISELQRRWTTMEVKSQDTESLRTEIQNKYRVQS